MSNLFKLAGYVDDYEEKIEKIAEAMDYMQLNGIDPIGGLVVIGNTDSDGNVLDEKVASVVENELTPDQADVLIKVAEYLEGVDERTLATAIELQKEAASIVEKVAEAKDYVESEFGVPFEDVMYVATAIENANSVDEKTASEIVEAGYGEEELEMVEKIASEVAAYTGLSPEEALESAFVLAETPEEQEKIAGLVDKVKQFFGKLFGRAPKEEVPTTRTERIKAGLKNMGNKVKDHYQKHDKAYKIGGGIAAGTALAGGGYYGYKKLKKNKKK